MKRPTVKQLFGISAVATGVLVVGSYTLLPVAAASNVSIPAPIANIAKQFNLDPSKVLQAFNDGKAIEDDTRLSQLVTDGKITAEQKTRILELRKVIDAKRAELEASGVSQSEFRAQMKTVQQALSDYLTSQKLTAIPELNRDIARAALLEAQLNSLVSEGKITEAQKVKILELQKAIETKRDELMDKGTVRSDMQTQLQPLEKALTDYLASQNLTTVVPLRPEGGGKGMGGPRGGGL